MKHDYIDQNQIVERYVMEKLLPDETEKFEQHYLHCARCRDEITLSEKLRTGFNDAIGSEVPGNNVTVGSNLWQRYLNFATQPEFATAATVLMALAITANLVTLRMATNAKTANENLALQLVQTTLPQSNLPIVLLSPVRSVRSIGNQPPDNQLTLDSEPKWVVLSMELPAESGFPPYRVALRDAESNTLWRDDNLLPNNNEEIVIGIHSSLFKKGIYSLQVEGLKTDDSWAAVSNYIFQVTPQ